MKIKLLLRQDTYDYNIIKLYYDNGFTMVGTIDKEKLKDSRLYNCLPNYDSDDKVVTLEIEDE